MSHAHSECGKQIREVLGRCVGGLTQAQLYEAVNFWQKSREIYGACLSAMCQAGDIIEIRKPTLPTLYVLKEHGPTLVESGLARARTNKKELAEQRHQERCRRLTALLGDGQLRTMSQLSDHVREVSIVTLAKDVDRMVGRGELQKIAAAPPVGNRYQLTKARIPPAEAPAAAPASAPSATPAPGAADLHPELQAIELKHWTDLNALLEASSYRAQDAYDAYIAATCDAKTLHNLREAITKSREALELHHKRRPA